MPTITLNGQPLPQGSLEPQAPPWPTTLQDAVDDQLGRLNSFSLYRLRLLPEQRLSDLYFGWGLGIRHAYGLARGNDALLASCGARHPDDGAAAIIRAVWRALRS